LEELDRLAATAGAKVVERLSQCTPSIHPATFIGRGKVEELKRAVASERAEVVIFDGDLSSAQQRNLERLLEIKVIDRSGLILDIFAQRARTSEGKLQVEVAQLEYLLPRLTRRWMHLSRLGGGIGTRGPGETQLEVDRRKVRERIATLRKRLREVERTRGLHREQRLTLSFPTVALVGYTNSGKSTLMNRLTNTGILVEDKLFATLDPTLRGIKLPNGETILISDTVGFIHKLPHQLIEAFRSTLEEVRTADLLLHIVDAAHPLWEMQKKIVETVLEDLGVAAPVLTVLNKIDLLRECAQIRSAHGQHRAYAISARTGQGVSELLGGLGESLPQTKTRLELSVPMSQGRLLAMLHREGRVLKKVFYNETVKVTVIASEKLAGRVKKILKPSDLEPIPQNSVAYEPRPSTNGITDSKGAEPDECKKKAC
jgi:GTP-binding protein HflX